MSCQIEAAHVLSTDDFSRVDLDQPSDNHPIVVLEISAIQLGDSPRLSGEDPEHTHRLAETDDILPPIIVHRQTMRVIDGMHRLRAAVLRGENAIRAQLYDGSEDAAFLLAVESNIAHGLPLSLSDRKSAAERIVVSHPERSDRAIATSTGLSDKTVRGIRQRASADLPKLNARVGADGRVRPVDSALGRQRASEMITTRPDASLREVANAAGISLGTARDVRARLRRGDNPVPPKLRAVGAADKSGSSVRSDRKAAPGDRLSTLESLKNDPSLRFTEAGREALRWLYSRSIEPEQWAHLIGAIPPHCAEVIAGLARGSGEAWYEFARQLEERGRQSG